MKISKRQTVSFIIFLISLFWFISQMSEIFIEKREWVRTTAIIEGFRLPKGWVSGYYVDENNVRQYSYHLYWHKFWPMVLDYENDLEPLIGTEVEIVYDPITGESDNYYYVIEETIYPTVNLIIWSAYTILCFKKPDKKYFREYKLQFLAIMLLVLSVVGCVNSWQNLIDVQDWNETEALIEGAGKSFGNVRVVYWDSEGKEIADDLQMFHFRFHHSSTGQGKDVEILYNPDTGEVAKYSRVIFNTVFFTLCWLGSSWFCMWSLKRLKRQES